MNLHILIGFTIAFAIGFVVGYLIGTRSSDLYWEDFLSLQRRIARDIKEIKNKR